MGAIIGVTVSVEDNEQQYDELLQALTEKAAHVDIGIHPVSGEELIMIATTHEFGATIEHPGGQPYIIVDARKRPKKQTRDQRSSFTPLGDGKEMIFLKKGQKGMGVTKPHTINIPQRSFIRSTIDEHRGEYERLVQAFWNDILDGEITPKQALSEIGETVQADIQNKIQSGIDPANKPETIRRKGSDKPLVDTGAMLQSIRYEVKSADEQTVASSS